MSGGVETVKYLIDNAPTFSMPHIGPQPAEVGQTSALVCLTGGAGASLNADEDRFGSECSPHRKPSPTALLMEIAEEADLFKTPNGDGYADLIVNGHRETWPISSEGFKRWLRQRYYVSTRQAPPTEALTSAIQNVEAAAQFGDKQHTVHVRVADHGGKLYIDMADAEWRAIEIDAEAWRVVHDAPVRFRRARGMLPIVEPLAGGSIADLRPFLNVQSDEDYLLAVAWILMALRPGGPYPVLVLSGEQGTAKSTFAATLRSLVDPGEVALKSLPRDERDLFIMASNGHVMAFDNVSNINAGVSDSLCRVATGGGFSTRKLYSDQDETIINAVKPIIVNGIGDVVTRPDLADRAMFLELAAIPEDKRMPLREFQSTLDAARPRIIGALLDAMVVGLQRFESILLDHAPRMADFAQWGVACEPAFGFAGSFMAAFRANRASVASGLVEAEPVAVAILALLNQEPNWEGTATELLQVLSARFGQGPRTEWPSDARSLSERVKRSAPNLRQHGVRVGFERRGRDRIRMIVLERCEVTVRGAC